MTGKLTVFIAATGIGLLGFVGYSVLHSRDAGNAPSLPLGVIYHEKVQEIDDADPPLPEVLPGENPSEPLNLKKKKPSRRSQAKSQDVHIEQGPVAPSEVAKDLDALPQWLKFFDEKAAPKPLFRRVEKDNIEFVLDGIAYEDSSALLRFHISNESPKELFILSITLEGRLARIAGEVQIIPSCRPGETVSGLLRTTREDVEGQRLNVYLQETLPRSRRWEIRNVEF